MLSNRRTALRDLTLLDVWDVSYRSWEVVDGAPVPIMIRGFLARPAGEAGVLPGVVSMHGLGGHAEEASATGPAALLGTVVLAPTGPGGGGDDPATRSEGTPASQDEGYRIFDTAEDPRGSWLWAHAVAAMRGVTCLETLDGVDDTRLGMTGFSAGGIATLLAASHDPRLVAAVPMSATGGWSAAARAPSSWFNALLSAAGLDTTSPEWAALVASIDPLAHLAASRTNILMINGSTDEFFPLASHQLTMDAIPPGLVTRTSLVGNFDHGCYLLTGGEAAATIEARARLRADGGQRFWFGHFFGTSAAVRRMPSAPEAVAVDAGGLTFVTAVVDEAGYEVNDVRFWWSNNDALFFVSGELEQGGGVWSALLPVPWTPGAIWYVDVEYSTGLIAPLRFSLSTAPQIPAGHVPAPRAITSCLP